MLKDNHRKNGNPGPLETPSSSRTSRLSPALKITGELTGTDNIVIEGAFEGRIHLDGHDVTLESGGRIKADLDVRNVTIRGSMDGNIRATGIVLIEASGRMAGDIAAARISVLEGAQFKGSVKITKS